MAKTYVLTIQIIYVKYMYLHNKNAMHTANKVQSSLGSSLKIGRNGLVILTLAAMQLFSACNSDPKVKKFDKRIQAIDALEIKNREESEYLQAKVGSDSTETNSDNDPTSKIKAEAAKSAAETTAKEKKEFDEANEKYEDLQKHANEAAK